MALLITSPVVDIPQGGTNATTAPTARVNLLPALAGNAGRVLAVNAGATDVEYIPVAGGGGTVTSVGLSMPSLFTVSSSPITTNGTIAVTYSGTALPIANGGTGGTTAANARTNFGATTVGSNLFTLTNPTAITFLRVNADNTVSTLDAATFRTAIGAGTSSTVGTVTSVGGTGTVSGLTLSGSVTSTGNLTLGGTLAVTAANFASQTANTFLSAPNGAAGVPTFRNIVAADVPTLNQNTTGTSANVTGTVAITNGGTGSTTAGAALTALGAQATLVSGTNIKTINSTSLLGSGDIVISSTAVSDTISLISTNTTAVRYTTYVCTATLTLTLPASPTAGDWVQVSNRSTVATIVVGRNAQNIMGLAEDMTINILNVGFRLVFADATRGWIVL